MKHSIWLVLTMIAAAALAFEARADSLPPFQPDRSLPPVAQLGQYLKRLDSDDWRTRESTTFQLARDQRISEDVIERSLSGTTLSQEQRLRLLRALETRLLLLPRGAIGVSMKRSITTFTDKDGNDISGVEIVELLPGMPAEEQLRVGDVLMSIEGQAFDHSDHVSSLIKQYWPGDEVELQVARDEPADAAGTPRRSRILHDQNQAWFNGSIGDAIAVRIRYRQAIVRWRRTVFVRCINDMLRVHDECRHHRVCLARNRSEICPSASILNSFFSRFGRIGLRWIRRCQEV